MSDIPPKQGPEKNQADDSTSAMLAMYKSAEADGTAYPVLQAFQKFIDQERAQARKKMFQLSLAFGLLLFAVILIFLVLGIVMMNNMSSSQKDLQAKFFEAVTAKQNQPLQVQSSPEEKQASVELANSLRAMVASMKEEQEKRRQLESNTLTGDLAALRAELQQLREDRAALQAKIDEQLEAQAKAEEERIAKAKAEEEERIARAVKEATLRTESLKEGISTIAAEAITKARQLQAEKEKAEQQEKLEQTAQPPKEPEKDNTPAKAEPTANGQPQPTPPPAEVKPEEPPAAVTEPEKPQTAPDAQPAETVKAPAPAEGEKPEAKTPEEPPADKAPPPAEEEPEPAIPEPTKEPPVADLKAPPPPEGLITTAVPLKAKKNKPVLWRLLIPE